MTVLADFGYDALRRRRVSKWTRRAGSWWYSWFAGAARSKAPALGVLAPAVRVGPASDRALASARLVTKTGDRRTACPDPGPAPQHQQDCARARNKQLQPLQAPYQKPLPAGAPSRASARRLQPAGATGGGGGGGGGCCIPASRAPGVSSGCSTLHWHMLRLSGSLAAAAHCQGSPVPG